MEDLAKLPGYKDARAARFARLGPKYRHITKKIQAEYKERIMRHPFYRGQVFWYLEDERGWLTDTVVLEIDVHKVVSPYRFPPGDRIPECIDGTPVIYFLNRTWAVPAQVQSKKSRIRRNKKWDIAEPITDPYEPESALRRILEYQATAR